MTQDQELLYRIGITKIPKVGPILAKNLISYSGSLEAVFKAKPSKLIKIPQVGAILAKIIASKTYLKEAEEELQYIKKHKIEALFYLDKKYPKRLLAFDQSPLLIYHKGVADLNHQKIISIVGTRTPTEHGVNFCEQIIEDLMPLNPLILSGLAYGIDIVSHKQAMRLGLPTVAVMGAGHGYIYPASHRKFAQDLINQGSLITEFCYNDLPDREHFPMRNRIIAGMCDAIIVVESGSKGGSMITAHIANDYNKDVFAVPGRLNDKMSLGCNHLIKTHKAHLLESAEDINYIMCWDQSEHVGKQATLFTDLDEQEELIAKQLEDASPLQVDVIARQTGIKNEILAAKLLGMEFKGIIKSLAGKRYMLRK